MLILRTSALQMRMDKGSFKNTVFEDGGVQNISRIKIYRTAIKKQGVQFYTILLEIIIESID